jgi:hypothetical protein
MAIKICELRAERMKGKVSDERAKSKHAVIAV